jgi:hypothetical protein
VHVYGDLRIPNYLKMILRGGAKLEASRVLYSLCVKDNACNKLRPQEVVNGGRRLHCVKITQDSNVEI